MADADELFFLAHDLGGAGHWADTITVQMGRVLEASQDVDRSGTPADHHRLHYESYFFLAAGIKVTKDQELKDARARFAASEAVNFRDWIEHLDAYFAGEGRMQKSGDVEPGATLSKLARVIGSSCISAAGSWTWLRRKTTAYYRRSDRPVRPLSAGAT